MSRRRLTQASAPPAMPGYQEPSNHPAAYPDPAANAYENGDTSSWAEDVHPGPYPNSAPPADPGMQEPQGHPATDPKHYFPAGAAKQASEQIRVAAEKKAALCIRIAQSMLGKKASIAAVEDQALDLMSLTDRQIQAMLKRIADEGGDGNPDLISNYTLTEPRQSATMMADDDGDSDDVEAMLASMMAEEEAKMEAAKKAEAEAKAMAAMKSGGGDALDKLADMLMDRLSKKMAADQNSPDSYKFEEKGKKGEDEPKEAKKAAKKGEDEAKEEPAKEAAKKAEDEAKEEPAKEEGDDKEAKKKAALRRLAGLEMSADMKATLAGLMAELAPEAAKALAGEEEPVAVEEEVTADDFLMDDGMDSMDLGDGDLDTSDLDLLYGMKTAAEDEDPKAEDEEPAKEAAKKGEDEAKEEPAKESSKKASAVRPQPRRASAGPKTLGTTVRTASAKDDDLSSLWTSAPDVSGVFR